MLYLEMELFTAQLNIYQGIMNQEDFAKHIIDHDYSLKFFTDIFIKIDYMIS